MPYFLQNRFARGELSDRMSEVAGTEVYEQGCPLLREGIITKQGTVKKRGGFAKVGATQHTSSARLFTFRTRTHGEFILEFRTGQIYSYKDGVYQGSVTNVSPYTEAELPDLRFQQVKEELIVCHPDYHPCVVRLDYEWNGSIYLYTWSFDLFDTLNRGPEMDPKRKSYPLSVVKAGSTDPALVAGAEDDSIEAFKDSDDGGTDQTRGIWRYSGENYVRVDPASGKTVVGPSKAFIEPLAISNTAAYLASGVGETGYANDQWAGPWLPSGALQTPGWTDITYVSGPSGGSSAFLKAGDIFTSSSANLVPGDQGSIVDFKDDGTNIGVILRVNGTNATVKLLHPTTSSYLQDGDTTGVTADWRFYRLEDRGTPDRGVTLQATGTSGTGIRVTASSLPGDTSSMPNIFDPNMVADGAHRPAGRIYMNGGSYEVTSFIDIYEVEATAVADDEPGVVDPTTCWSLGWSKHSGYPRSVGWHQQRLVFSGVAGYPNKLLLSRVNQHKNFDIGPLDGDALNLAIGAETGSGGIQWIESLTDLIVGTEDAEYAIRGQPLSASDIGVDLQSTWGSTDIQPLVMGNSVIFVTKDKKRIRQISFQFDADRYTSTDITLTAEHFFDGTTIKEISYLRDPDGLLIAVLENGDLLSASYYPEEGVLGWSKWTIDNGLGVDDVLSATVRRQEGSGQDELWVITERGTSDDRFVEKYDGVAVNDHEQSHSGSIDVENGLAGRYIDVIETDGRYRERLSLAVGTATATPTESSGKFGFPIQYRMSPQLTQYRDREGATAGRKRIVTGCRLKVNGSYGGAVEGYYIEGDVENTDTDNKTKWHEVVGLGVNTDTGKVTYEITHDTPHTFEVLAVSTMTTEVGL